MSSSPFTIHHSRLTHLRLGINIDHVATLRNARGGMHPDPVRAALLAEQAGADGITIHLREDRRHIRDADAVAIKNAITLPLNFEMAATDEMVAFALALKPNAACLVPERREEVTTEGGLNVAAQEAQLAPKVAALKAAGIRVSLFVDADPAQIEAAHAVGADIVELHTGEFCHHFDNHPNDSTQLARIVSGAKQAAALGLEVHAGHGLCYQTTPMIAAISEIVELNIGHFIMGEALFDGLPQVIARFKALMQEARK